MMMMMMMIGDDDDVVELIDDGDENEDVCFCRVCWLITIDVMSTLQIIALWPMMWWLIDFSIPLHWYSRRMWNLSTKMYFSSITKYYVQAFHHHVYMETFIIWGKSLEEWRAYRKCISRLFFISFFYILTVYSIHLLCRARKKDPITTTTVASSAAAAAASEITSTAPVSRLPTAAEQQ